MSPSQKKDTLRKMKAVALSLKQAGKTQAQIGVLLGVARQTVAVWLMPNAKDSNRRTPDSRVKVSVTAHPVIVERIESGESQNQVAADYGIGQQQVSRIVTKEQKQQTAKRERKAAVKKLGSEKMTTTTKPNRYVYLRLPKCPFCGSTKLRAEHTEKRSTGQRVRHSRCKQCGERVFVVVQ